MGRFLDHLHRKHRLTQGGCLSPNTRLPFPSSSFARAAGDESATIGAGRFAGPRHAPIPPLDLPRTPCCQSLLEYSLSPHFCFSWSAGCGPAPPPARHSGVPAVEDGSYSVNEPFGALPKSTSTSARRPSATTDVRREQRDSGTRRCTCLVHGHVSGSQSHGVACGTPTHPRPRTRQTASQRTSGLPVLTRYSTAAMLTKLSR